MFKKLDTYLVTAGNRLTTAILKQLGVRTESYGHISRLLTHTVIIYLNSITFVWAVDHRLTDGAISFLIALLFLFIMVFLNEL